MTGLAIITRAADAARVRQARNDCTRQLTLIVPPITDVHGNATYSMQKKDVARKTVRGMGWR